MDLTNWSNALDVLGGAAVLALAVILGRTQRKHERRLARLEAQRDRD